jgi:hypothetical protein
MGSDFLYANPSFWSGMASAMDLGGTLSKEYNRSSTPNQADFRALRSDWAVTGLDLFNAMDKFGLTQCQRSSTHQ